MAEDLIRYDRLAQKALRGVIREVLESVVKNGLPGEHHLYIAFRTDFSGVQMSQRLRATYSHEMTIVLQHQYWDLEVEDDFFQVSLSFNNNAELLIIPYASIKGFFDPSVQFGLQFDDLESAESAQSDDAAQGSQPEDLEGHGANEGSGAPAEKDGTAAVVSLDSFRKKS